MKKWFLCGKILNGWFSLSFTDGSEQQQTIRSKRAKKPRTPGAPAFGPEPDQRIDEERSESDIPVPVIPQGFLSPSVKEYLELGKSIPGLLEWLRKKSQIRTSSQSTRFEWCDQWKTKRLKHKGSKGREKYQEISKIAKWKLRFQLNSKLNFILNLNF